MRDQITRCGLPAHEARRLLAIATGRSRVELARDDALDEASVRRFDQLVARRLAGEPLQHIEGTVEFGPLELRTDRRALIPRPETEELWELAVGAVADRPPGVIVDLCTGGGNLALSLKHRFPRARVLATDMSRAALELAEENAARTGLAVGLFHGDLFDPLPPELRGRVDLVVANPPYLSEAEFAAAPLEVREHDPREALVGGPQGDEVLVRIAAEVGEWLAPGGVLVVEIGWRQGPRARELFSALGGEVRRDLSGRDRFVVGCADES